MILCKTGLILLVDDESVFCISDLFLKPRPARVVGWETNRGFDFPYSRFKEFKKISIILFFPLERQLIIAIHQTFRHCNN